jgi:methylenetetrahydrofolate reductase (NADPH)
VFQKAYLEFFCSPEAMQQLLRVVQEYPHLAYHALNHRGDEYTNVDR